MSSLCLDPAMNLQPQLQPKKRLVGLEEEEEAAAAAAAAAEEEEQRMRTLPRQ